MRPDLQESHWRALRMGRSFCLVYCSCTGGSFRMHLLWHQLCEQVHMASLSQDDRYEKYLERSRRIEADAARLAPGELTEALRGPVAGTPEPHEESPIPWRLDLVERVRRRVCEDYGYEVILPGKIRHPGWNLRARFRFRDWSRYGIRVSWELTYGTPDVYFCTRRVGLFLYGRNVRSRTMARSLSAIGDNQMDEICWHANWSDDPVRRLRAKLRLAWFTEEYLLALMTTACQMASGDLTE